MAVQLSRMEKFSLDVCRSINEHPKLKALQRTYLEYLCCPIVHACTSNLRTVYGLEKLYSLRPERGVMLCANHRSFVDLYVVAAIMYKCKLPWNRRHYYPVRSNYFYETWAGLSVNLFVGGGSMYPPIFRDASKAEHTKAGIQRIVRRLETPGSVAGLHPEGTRCTSPDPFELLPAQPGIGQIAHQSQASVVPIWIRGLSTDVGKQVLSNFQKGGKRGQPVVVAFGDPVDLSEYRAKTGRAAVYKHMSDKILDDIRKLSEEDRQRSHL